MTRKPIKKLTEKPILPKEKPEFVVLTESPNKNVEKLFEIYALDKAKARTYYYINNITPDFYTTTRTVAFEYSNGDVRIAKINKRYGISTTNKMFSGESNEWVIIYKKEQNKYYFQRKYTFKGYCLGDLGFNKDNKVKIYLCSKFPVLRTAFEQLEKCYYFNAVQVNVIASKKIFSQKAMLRHIWGTPYKIAEILMNVNNMTPPLWNEIKQSLYNIENIRPGLFNDEHFRDTRKFAAALGKKINCAWSEKRLKLQHDIWTKEVVETILEFEELRDLKIREIFKDFADFSGLKLFLTNHELIAEGKKMSHCVGTYSGEVDAGRSAIYSYGDGTLELGVGTDWENLNKTILQFRQYKGYNNKDISGVNYKFIISKLKEFNDTIDADSKYNFDENEIIENELPF